MRHCELIPTLPIALSNFACYILRVTQVKIRAARGDHVRDTTPVVMGRLEQVGWRRCVSCRASWASPADNLARIPSLKNGKNKKLQSWR